MDFITFCSISAEDQPAMTGHALASVQRLSWPRYAKNMVWPSTNSAERGTTKLSWIGRQQIPRWRK